MYALCVSGTVNTLGFVWKFLCAIYNVSFIPSSIHTPRVQRRAVLTQRAEKATALPGMGREVERMAKCLKQREMLSCLLLMEQPHQVRGAYLSLQPACWVC